MNVFIIIPTFNERDNIKRIANYIDDNDFYNNINAKFILIDDTEDNSVLEESKKSDKIIEIKNGRRLGYGLSLRKGLYISKFLCNDITIIMDADHPIKYIENIIGMINNDGYYFVIGNEKERTIFSKVTKKLLRFGLGIKVNHPTCGFMGFSRQAINDLNIDNCISNNDMLHVEFVLQMTKEFNSLKVNYCEFIFSGQNKNNKAGYGGYKLKRIIIWIIDYLKVVYREIK
jgi:hypothetical protein